MMNVVTVVVVEMLVKVGGCGDGDFDSGDGGSGGGGDNGIGKFGGYVSMDDVDMFSSIFNFPRFRLYIAN